MFEVGEVVLSAHVGKLFRIDWLCFDGWRDLSAVGTSREKVVLSTVQRFHRHLSKSAMAGDFCLPPVWSLVNCLDNRPVITQDKSRVSRARMSRPIEITTGGLSMIAA